MAQENRAKLWNLNFFLLWQGRLISVVGDIVYEIALGFWILAVTGSTALMGTLMAATILPRVIIAPFAGVWVDRSDRKWLLVWMDLIRGVLVILVGIAAITGIIQIWMVFVTGVILGMCGAFFGTAVNSAIPDIVPKTHIVKANSALALVYTGTGIIGNSAGGFLYQLLGAPWMFLINGISYIVSGLAEIFVKIPKVIQQEKEFRFFEDLKVGFSYVWNEKGIRYLMLIAAVLNFFASMGFMLFIPLFQRTEHLGPGLYGVLMGVFAGGLFLGFSLASAINIKPTNRFFVFFWCGIAFSVMLVVIPLYLYFPLMLAFSFIAGTTNAILNALLGSILQLAVPQDKRGKVFGLMEALSQGLIPLSFAIGGILAGFIPLQPFISVCFMITLFSFVPMAFMPDIIGFVNVDMEGENPAESTSNTSGASSS
jgi:DHA3 family macrolide efflux protein-like MFS transporter